MRNGRITRHDNGSGVTDDELFADDPRAGAGDRRLWAPPRRIAAPEQHGVRTKMSATSGRTRASPLQSELDQHKRVVECMKEHRGRRPGQLMAVFAT